MNKIKICNMLSGNGNKVPNQFIISADDGQYFQSYDTIIAFQVNDGTLTLDAGKWDYSVTTSKYRNRFTGLSSKETRQKLTAGEIKLADLN